MNRNSLAAKIVVWLLIGGTMIGVFAGLLYTIM